MAQPPPALGPWAAPAEQELRRLFDLAFRYDAKRHSLEEASPEAVGQFRAKLDAVALQARGHPYHMLDLNDPRITRYWYFADPKLTPQDKGFLWRIDHGELDPTQACGEMNRFEIDEVKSYQGGGLPAFVGARGAALVHGFYSVLAARGVGELSANLACHADTEAIADPGRRGKEDRYPFLSEAEKSNLFISSTERLEQRLAELQTTLLTSADPREKREAYLRGIYIASVLTARSLATFRDLQVEGCLRNNPATGREACEYAADIASAEQTSHPLDNDRFRFTLKERLQSFYIRYAVLTPLERTRLSSRVQDGLLLLEVTSGLFGPPMSEAEVEAVFGAISAGTGLSHLPPDRTMDLKTLSETEGAAEIRIDNLPIDIVDQAKAIPFKEEGDPKIENAWDYIRRHIRTVIFAKSLDSQSGVGEPDASANRLLKTVVVNLQAKYPKGAELQGLVAALVHEASHNAFAWHEVPKDRRLARAGLLDERNAHLRQARVYQAVRDKRKEGDETWRALTVFIETKRATALATNSLLGYPASDDRPRTDLLIDPDDPRLGLYPTQLLSK